MAMELCVSASFLQSLPQRPLSQTRLSLSSTAIGHRLSPYAPSPSSQKPIIGPAGLSSRPLAVTGEEIWQLSEDAVAETVENGAISFLFFAAFLGLSILTAGVIYLGVSDFMEKRQRDKELQAVAASEGKKKKPKKALAARQAARGFGKRMDDE